VTIEQGSFGIPRKERPRGIRKKTGSKLDRAAVHELWEANVFKWRLRQIGNLLKPEDPYWLGMTEMEKAINRAELEIEQNWLQLKCKVTTPEQQRQLLAEYMEKLSKTMPDVYNALVYVKLAELPRSQLIKNKVFPPERR